LAIAQIARLRSGRSTQLIWTDLMILSRQQFLRLAACSAALTAASRLVMAHAYLAVRNACPLLAGGSTDIFARLILPTYVAMKERSA
jgi:hypothetical protein